MRPWLIVAALTLACGPDKTTSPSTVTAKSETKTDAKTDAKTDTKTDTKADTKAEPKPLSKEALAKELLILDGHVDVPWRLEKSSTKDGKLTEDVTGPTESGDFDYPRAVAGGLDAPFMSIYVSPKFEGKGAKKVADGLIDVVEGIVAKAPDKFALAPTVASVRANFAAGKISLPMGMENGAPIEGDLANVAYFHGRGIRYITLAHSKDNHISDSSYDKRHTHGGLSKFGEKVVAEMNRVGIMVDVSHLSDDAFEDVMRVSKVPVIASHSSCRHFTPGWERNMSDAMIETLADKGGVIQINFGSTFLSGEIKDDREKYDAALDEHLASQKLDPESDEGKAAAQAYAKEHPAPRAGVKTVADHIDHVVKLVGVDHVGLGSDFDGVGDSLPDGLRDVSGYPNLIGELRDRGYDREALEKIASDNVLRVWAAVEQYAAGQ